MAKDTLSGVSLALGTVAALAVAGAITSRRQGSRASFADFLQERIPSKQGQLVGTTRAKVNAGAMWTLAAEKLYGSHVDVPIIATREALQNSRDAIGKAIKAREIGAKDGFFKVEWEPEGRMLAWDDNGIGMSREIVDTKFLSLGDTTKIATAQRQEIQAGGFGLAKAILLGASKTFTWTLDTRDHQFRADGFDHDIQIRKISYRQGTRLAVYAVASKHDRQWYQRRHLSIPERLTAFLATNKTPFPIFYNGIEVPYAFSGKGAVVEEGADWGPGTTGTVRVYKRSQENGHLYVRLFGLTQFVYSIANGKAEFDVTVDIETTLAPTEDGYPFTASRMSLSGPAERTLERIRGQFDVDVLSSIRGAEPELTGEGEVDYQAKARTESQMAALLRTVSDDPEIEALYAALGSTGDAVRKVFRQVQRQIPPQRQSSRSTAGEAPEAFQKFVKQANTQTPPEAKPQAKPQAPRPKRSDGGSNPFAGAGKLKVNHAEWDKKRLAPYLKNPEALLPLLALWQLAVQFVYSEMTPYVPTFTVGFLFDDSLRAEYDPKNDRLFSINPVPILKLVQALPDNPAVIAAYLHNKACHEVTHALGLGVHDEAFISKRESVADRTAQLLAPLTLLTARLLGMKRPNAPRKPRKKSEAKVRMRTTWGGSSALIENRAQGEKQSPLYVLASELTRLLSEAGFPAQMDEANKPEEDFRMEVYVNYEDYGERHSAIVLYKDDFSGAGFYNTEWRDILTPAQRDSLRNDTSTLIPLASQLVRYITAKFAERGYQKPETGSSNRTPLPRRALLRQAEAILARG